MKKHQLGLATVEFAVVALVFFMLLFGIIEMGRLLFTWNTLVEATRRGARVAAVCPLNDPAIASTAIFDFPAGAGTSAILSGLTTSNIAVQYLDSAGTVTAVWADIRYVQVGITGYQHTLMIPSLMSTLTAPAFTTRLPRESLGVVPGGGAMAC